MPIADHYKCNSTISRCYLLSHIHRWQSHIHKHQTVHQTNTYTHKPIGRREKNSGRKKARSKMIIRRKCTMEHQRGFFFGKSIRVVWQTCTHTQWIVISLLLLLLLLLVSYEFWYSASSTLYTLNATIPLTLLVAFFLFLLSWIRSLQPENLLARLLSDFSLTFSLSFRLANCATYKLSLCLGLLSQSESLYLNNFFFVASLFWLFVCLFSTIFFGSYFQLLYC